MSIEQRLDLEREDRQHESTLARLGGRLKFTGCPECGSDFGMYSASREEMAIFLPGAIERLAPWYKEADNDLVLYHECMFCNWRGCRSVPDGMEPVGIVTVLEWFNRDPMQQGDSDE